MEKEEEEEEEEASSDVLNIPLVAVLVVDNGGGMLQAGFLQCTLCSLLTLAGPRCLAFWLALTQKDRYASLLLPRSLPTPAVAYAGLVLQGQLCSGLVLLVVHLALCSFLLSSGPRFLSSWPVRTRRSVAWCRAVICGFSAGAVHRRSSISLSWCRGPFPRS